MCPTGCFKISWTFCLSSVISKFFDFVGIYVRYELSAILLLARFFPRTRSYSHSFNLVHIPTYTRSYSNRFLLASFHPRTHSYSHAFLLARLPTRTRPTRTRSYSQAFSISRFFCSLVLCVLNPKLFNFTQIFTIFTNLLFTIFAIFATFSESPCEIPKIQIFPPKFLTCLLYRNE